MAMTHGSTIVLPLTFLYFWFSRKYIGTIWSSWITSCSLQWQCPVQITSIPYIWKSRKKKSVAFLLEFFYLWFFGGHFAHFIMQLLQISTNFFWTAGLLLLDQIPASVAFTALSCSEIWRPLGKVLTSKWVGPVDLTLEVSPQFCLPAPALLSPLVFCDVFRILYNVSFLVNFSSSLFRKHNYQWLTCFWMKIVIKRHLKSLRVNSLYNV